MLAAGLLAHALRGAVQRMACSRALAAATAAWQRLQAGEQGVSAGGFGSSHSWLNQAGNCGSGSFSSSAVISSRGEASNMGGSSGGSDKGQRKHGPRTQTAEPQPQLQAWLQQQQGLSSQAADQHARRLAHIFGSQQAALDGLPATFEWGRSRGLTGLQTAQLLNQIGKLRRQSVVQFAATAQPAWHLLESYIAAHIEPLRQAGAKLPKHTSLAEQLRSSAAAAQALAMPPRHVEAWLAAVSQRLPAAAIGKLLLSHAAVVTGSPTTPLAAISWVADVLGVADPAAFFAGAPSLLLKSEATTLQRKLDSLQQALGWSAQRAKQLVLRQPALLGSSPETVQAALTWLRQLFPDAEQLAGVIDRGPQLLGCSVQHLQGNADYLQQELGWQDGDGQLAAFVAARPSDYGVINLTSEETEHKLRLLSEVVGVSRQECLGSGITCLRRRLEGVAAHYMLALERAPRMLFNRHGELHISWTINVSLARYRSRLGLSDAQYHAFVREWPASEEGRRLLEGLRAGSVEGWPRPSSWQEAQQQQSAEQQRAAGTKQQAVPQKRRARAAESSQADT